jgi:hypothetical protein
MSNTLKICIAVLALIALVIVLAVLWFITGDMFDVMTSEPAIALLCVARLAMLAFGIFFGALLLIQAANSCRK